MAATQTGPATRSSPATAPLRVRVPIMLQQASVECGAASLGMILGYYGRWVGLDRLREDCGVDRDGATLQNIAHAAQGYGLAFQGHFGDVNSLDGVAVPAILWWDRKHFVVLEGAHKGRFAIADPAGGRYTLDRGEFEASYSGVGVLLSPTEEFIPEGRPYQVTRGLRDRLAHSKPGVTFAVIAGMLAMLLGVLVGPLNEVFINDILGLDKMDRLPVLVVAMLSIGAFRAGLTLLQFSVLSRLQAKFSLIGTVGLIDRLIRLPVLFYLARASGDLSQRLSYNTMVAQLLAGQVATSAIALLATAGYAALLIYYNWLIGLIVLAIASVNALALRAVQRRRTELQNRILKQHNRLYGSTTASIREIETLKATGRESEVFADLVGQQAGYVSATARMAPTSAFLAALPLSLGLLTSAAILVLGGYFTIQGAFTIGALLAMQALALSLNAPIQTLMATGSQLQLITASMMALDDVLKNQPDQRFDRPTLEPDEEAIDLSGRLEMVDVSFAFGPRTEPVIRGLNLQIWPGRRVALVGTSGAGKTTIGNLAAGLYEPTSGQVLYNGVPLMAYAVPVVERAVAKVDQSIVLFEGTVRENVTLWDPSIPEADVLGALADAQVLDDILARPGSLDAVVEEDGRNFSGGQAQRIEIARALVRNPRLIILDEATSALDDVTEKRVDEAIRRRGMAALIIAHRLSTIRDADEIVVLGRGGLVLDRGTHENLISLDGAYTRMVDEAGEGGHVGS